ncbi:MAG: HD domain-containing protein [bacterium]|nr:HD domain-containing protein [bacterium]
MNKFAVLEKTKQHVRALFEREGTGHDWWHIERVFNNATTIAKKEKGADLFIVQLGALLHDVADFKFHGGDETIGGRVAARWLKGIGVAEDTIKKVVHIVDNVSFKGLGVRSKMKSLEGKIVQDADRLDAIGAIGIARAFAYGGHKGRALFNPEGKTKKHKSFKAYKKGSDSTIHHFYEKLLYLKDRMNTKTAKRMALQRHTFLKAYLDRFHAEWRGLK